MTRTVNFRYYVVRNGADYCELHAVEGAEPKILMDDSSAIKTKLSGSFLLPDEEVNWLTDEIQPVMIVDGVEHSLGVFLPANVSETETDTARRVSVDSFDRGWIAKDYRTERMLFFLSGTAYIDAISSILAECGITLISAVPSAETLAEDRADWEIGTPALDIVNQLLAEMDGFDPEKGIMVLGATNRPEVLDKALLRPGRFDRRIIMDTPNFQGRLDTLKVHTRKIKLAEDVDLRRIAQTASGAVGADLANLVNEAALRAVRKGRKMVTQEDLLAAFETVMMGSEKKNTVRTETERRMTAYHEVGHALVAALEKNAMPVSKITIIPRTGGSLGATMYIPEEEKNLYTREDLIAKIHSLLGGRAAEEVVFGTMTTGASNDLQRATALARDMIARYGMSSELGLLSPTVVTSQYLDGQSSLDCSQETAATVDKAARSLLETCYAEDKQVLTENRALLDEISEYLLVKETITGDELMAFVNADQKQLPEAAEEAAESTPSTESEV